MNKTELIAAVALETGSTKAAASIAVEGVVAVIKQTVANGDSVSLVGFGTFLPVARDARTGKNPATGAALDIKASVGPKFKPGQAFKDEVDAAHEAAAAAAKKTSKKK